MRKSVTSIFLGFIFLAALAANAQAQMCGCMHEDGMMGEPGHRSMGMMHDRDGGMQHCAMMDDDHPMWKQLMRLGLDEKQKEALKALRSKTMKDMARKQADEQIAGIELKDLLDKEPADMKAVEAAAKKEGALKTEVFLTHIRAHEEMKSILTADQRKQLKEMTESGGAGCMMHGDSEQKPMPMHDHMH